MKTFVLAAGVVAGLTLAAGAASAQPYGYGGYGYSQSYSQPYGYDRGYDRGYSAYARYSDRRHYRAAPAYGYSYGYAQPYYGRQSYRGY